MDKLSIFGLLLGFFAIIGGQVLEGGSIFSLLNGPAFLIVVGGTLGACMLQTPWYQFSRGLQMLKWLFFPPAYAIQPRIDILSQWAMMARSNGFLVLEDALEEETDPFVRKGLMMLIDGQDEEHIRETLEMEVIYTRDELGHSAKVYEAMGGYSPTIGILGAVLGLIQSMQYLDDPTKLGGGIATAFVATIYGVGFANLLYLPVYYKLRNVIYRQAMYSEMVIEGLLLIRRGENPFLLQGRLSAFKVASLNGSKD